MRFDRESWVKLYRQESPPHRLMSLEARTFRDFLLRHAGDGTGLLLERSDNVSRDLCRVIAADSSDSKKVARWLKELETVGYVTIGSEGRLTITKFVEAQTVRSPGAKRQAEYEARERAKRAPDVKAEVSPDEPESVRTDAEPDVTTDVIREENRREREERRDPPKPPNEGDPLDGPANSLAIPCPRDLLEEAVIVRLSELFGVDAGVVRSEEREFKSYWTIGFGAGTQHSRAMWVRKFRERLRKRIESGEVLRGPNLSAAMPASPIAVATREAAERAFEERRERELGLAPKTATGGAP